MESKNNYINPETFEKIIEYLPSLEFRKWDAKDVQYLFKISYWCGLRMSESCKIKAEDIDIEAGEIYLGLTKKKKNSIAIIPPSFKEELWDYIKEKPDGLLLPDVNPQIVRVWIRKIGKDLNIKAWTTSQEETGEKTQTHIFRKSSAKDLLMGTHGKKAPLNIIQKILRHDSLDTTSKYLKVDTDAVKEFYLLKE